MNHRLMMLRWGGLLLILGISFALRVWGLPFGLPYEFHPDERQYVSEALNWHMTDQLHTGTVNPPLFIYILAAAYQPWLILSPFVPADTWIVTAYTFARLWSVAFGLLTVTLVFTVGKRMHSTRLGVTAMVLYAGLFLPARESHFAVNDTTASFFALLAVYAAVGILRWGRRADYALAGVAVGLAAAAKLNMAIVGVAPLAAHALAGHVRPFKLQTIVTLVACRRAWGGLGIAALTFMLISLPLFLDPIRFTENIGQHLQFGTDGYKGLQMAPVAGWLYYLNVLGWGLGWLMVLVILGGLGWVLAHRFQPGYVIAIFPVVLFFYMGGQKILFARFLLPAVSPLVLLAALGMTALDLSGPQLRRRLYPLLFAALLAQPLVYLIRFDWLLTQPDTRQLSSNWLVEQFPLETVLVKESYSVFPNKFFAPQSWPFKTIQIDERGPTRNNVTHYVAHKTNLIAVSNFTYARVRGEAAAEIARQQQLNLLIEKATLLKEFNPYRHEPNWFYLDELYGPAGETLQRERPGPLIKIYSLPYQNQPFSLDMPDIPVPVKANFDNKLVLLGYYLPQRRANPGGVFPLTLYWQAFSRMDKTYIIFNHLLDSKQHNWGGYDRWPQETANTTLWQPGEVVVDSFNLPVSPHAPNGVYSIDLGVYNQADPQGTPLPIVRDGVPVAQNSVRIGPVKVGASPPSVTLSPTSFRPQTKLNIQMGFPPVVALRGTDLLTEDNALHITLYWESLAPTPVDWSIFAHLRDATNQTVAQKDGPAGGGRYPTSLWDIGDLLPDQLVMPLPSNFPAGEYSLIVGLYNLADGTRLVVPDSSQNEILIKTGLTW
jgi:4-amino-4-deoxy-L-arabinose transferase-like glycosyltransferase